MSYSVKVITLTDPFGERLPLVTHKVTGIPHVEVNQYLLRKRRGIVSFNTIIKEANVLVLLLEWLGANDQDLSYLKIDKVGSRDVYNLWERLRSSKGKDSSNTVSGPVHMYRWKVVQKFLKHMFSNELIKESYKTEKFSNFVVKRDEILKEFKSLDFSAKTGRRKGLDPKIIEKILILTRENSDLNPWIKRDRLRNELIFDFLIFLGIRASELLKIEIQDINLKGQFPTVTIKRIEDDPNDPRKYEPRVKTHGRILDINLDISLKLTKYLRMRRLIKNGKKSRYLFLSHRTGTPMSYIALSKLVSRLESSCLDLQGTGLSPHSFRRSWNDRFREAGEKNGVNEESITQSQNYLQGRNLDSPEAYKYAQRHIEKSAREVLLKMQKGLLDGIK